MGCTYKLVAFIAACLCILGVGASAQEVVQPPARVLFVAPEASGVKDGSSGAKGFGWKGAFDITDTLNFTPVAANAEEAMAFWDN